MTIKLHQNCAEGRHVFIPTRWEEDVKIQQRWVTEFSCQHCLHFVGTDEWRDHIMGKYVSTSSSEINVTIPSQSERGTVFEVHGGPITSGEGIKIINVTPPKEITKDALDKAVGPASYIPIGKPSGKLGTTEPKKRGRPFAKDKNK
jgi:hypothetical protein